MADLSKTNIIERLYDFKMGQYMTNNYTNKYLQHIIEQNTLLMHLSQYLLTFTLIKQILHKFTNAYIFEGLTRVYLYLMTFKSRRIFKAYFTHVPPGLKRLSLGE